MSSGMLRRDVSCRFIIIIIIIITSVNSRRIGMDLRVDP